MMDGLRFALDMEPGAYFGGDGQLDASKLKILMCIYVSEENLDFNLAYGSWRTYRLNPDRDSN